MHTIFAKRNQFAVSKVVQLLKSSSFRHLPWLYL